MWQQTITFRESRIKAEFQKYFPYWSILHILNVRGEKFWQDH